MYKKRINKHWFEFEEETNRIVVYAEGSGVSPIAYIYVEKSIKEKDFDYEIMAWSVDNNII
jgi:hypothetical protein